MASAFWRWVEKNKLVGAGEDEVRRVLEPLPAEFLDRMAFGFSGGHVATMDPDLLVIVYPDDLAAAKRDAGRDPKAWAKGVSLREPVEVMVDRGRFCLKDGHHRWWAAKLTGRKLRARIEIADNPINAILARIAAGR